MDEDSFSHYDEDQSEIPFDYGREIPSPCSRFINATLFLDGEKNGFLAWILSPGLFLDWTPIHHISLQCSQIFILGIFLLPNQRFLIRFLGVAYGLCFLSFGYFVFRSLDIVAWSLAHILVNLCYMTGWICRSIFQSYSKELEQVTLNLFSIMITSTM